MEEINVWYYTLSTSAQVLAALAGLFAVFVVYKIQSMSNTIVNYSGHHPDYKDKRLVLQEIILLADDSVLIKLDYFLSHYEKLSNEERVNLYVNNGGSSPLYGINYCFDRYTYNLYKNLLSEKRDIIRRLSKIIILSFLTISICLLFLVFSFYINNIYTLFFQTSLVILTLIIIAQETLSISKK